MHIHILEFERNKENRMRGVRGRKRKKDMRELKSQRVKEIIKRKPGHRKIIAELKTESQ